MLTVCGWLSSLETLVVLTEYFSWVFSFETRTCLWPSRRFTGNRLAVLVCCARLRDDAVLCLWMTGQYRGGQCDLIHHGWDHVSNWQGGILCTSIDTYLVLTTCRQCFDSVGWASGRAFGLLEIEWWGAGVVVCLKQGANDLHVIFFSWFWFCFLGTSQEIGWEEHLRNGLYCVEWDVKPLLSQSVSINLHIVQLMLLPPHHLLLH